MREQNKEQTPELLLPAGNTETFLAAVEGGADAVYMGLKDFNARGRARNFTNRQLAGALKYAHGKSIEIYVTLNTVIKNNEIGQLLDTLNTLNQLQPDAVIIQDWGVWYLIKEYFPKLKVHASTQMAIHNSTGVSFAATKGFERVIVARELTLNELKGISEKKKTEIECFIHGALCYSFSGVCLYSSFVGGQGANRGLCKQPCRRIFHSGDKQNNPFSLKDMQLLDHISQLKEMGIDSLKVEGRLKSANYVNSVAKAYRMALDGSDIQQSNEILKMDLSRPKTSYFVGHSVKEAITSHTASGLFLGKLEHHPKHGLVLESKTDLLRGDRLRVVHKDGSQTAKKLSEIIKSDNFHQIDHLVFEKAEVNDPVYLASRKDIVFQAKNIPESNVKIKQLDTKEKTRILNQLKGPRSKKQKSQMFVRINSFDWIRKVQFNSIDGLLLRLPYSQWKQIRFNAPFVQQNIHKIYAELPTFIAEDSIQKWKNLVHDLSKKGIKNFSVGHISQSELVPSGQCTLNENVYAFNNAAIAAFGKMGFKRFIYPVENDMDNFKSYSNRSGIVYVYGKPSLFYSRMPVKLENGQHFKDDYGIDLEHYKQDGITNVVPNTPVSLSQYINDFRKIGYTRFLIDFSFEKPSKNKWNTILKRVKSSQQIQPSTNFNIKEGLI